MEDILVSIEHQLCAIHVMEDRLSNPAQGFVSAIKINGKPIPPPVMTEQKRLEMRNLKLAAVKRENELANHRRFRLLDKVQTIVDQIEERRSSSQGSQVDEDAILHEDKTDFSLNQDNLELRDEVIPPTATVNQACQSTLLPGLPCPIAAHLQDNGKPAEGVTSGQGSTSSSSDISLLNQTVVAVSDFSKNPTTEPSDPAMSKNSKVMDGKVNTVMDVPSASHSLSPLGNSSEISRIQTNQDWLHVEDQTKSIDSNSQGITTGVRLACSWHKEIEPSFSPKSLSVFQDEHLPCARSYLMPNLIHASPGEVDEIESFGERDSYLSLLGEYSSLPMPTGSSHFFSDVSQVPTKSGNDSGKTPIRSAEKPGQNECIGSAQEEDFSIFLSTSSTLMTNTLGQSCTLPYSLRTVSAASTLHDIDDPWNTLVETPVPSTQLSDICLKGNVSRGTPVGQEDSKETTHVQDAPISNNSEKTMFSSPEKRVRRDSYTLEHPSPALLSAQARNEAPQVNQAGSQHKSSDGGSPQMSVGIGNSDTDLELHTEKENQTKDQPLDQNNETTEENVLQLQLQYLEQMRQRLEQQQKQQLQQLLIDQQQAQISLQQEMTQLQRQFQQKQHHDIDQRESNTEDVPQIVSEGKEANADGQVLTTSAIGSQSNEPSPTSLSSQPILSKDASMAASSTINSAIIATNSGQTEPFYLGGNLGNHDEAKTSSPTAMRMPCSGENVQTTMPFGRPNNKVRYDKVSAVAKGHLTRRVFKSQRVQSIIQTIKDSATFADKFVSETPIKKGGMSLQDMALAERVLAQVRASQYDLYDIFHTYTAAQRMELIKQSRVLISKDEEKIKTSPEEDRVPSRPLSAATIKALERKKKARVAEAKLFGDNKLVSKVQSRRRPMSAAEGRILKPLLSQRSPARPSSANQYRPSRYGDVISEDLPKAKDPVRSKVTSQRVPGNSKEGSKSSRTRSPATSKTKGVRRSLYPVISHPSKRIVGRTTDRK